MKERLISISLAVLLAMGLVIMVFPAQAVEASYDHKQGIVYHIEAEGPATFDQEYPPGPEVDGEFYIKLDGSGYFHIMGRGLAWHGGGGHLKGSFDNNEIDLVLQVYRVYCNPSWLKAYPNLNISIWFWAMGVYNGEKVQHDWKNHRSYGKLFLKPHEGKLTIDKIRLHLYDKNNNGYVYWIYIDESTADIFKVDIDIVGY